MKRCNRCLVEKEDSQFEVGQNKCIPCHTKRRDYYLENRSQEIARAKKHANKDRNHTNELKRKNLRKNPVSYILWRTKSKCKKESIPFDLTHADIIVPSHCPILGIPLIIGDTNSQDGSPSIDRKDPKLGYVRGNIQIISHKANTIKSDATILEIEKVWRYMKQMLG